jgi:hypothetical protein
MVFIKRVSKTNAKVSLEKSSDENIIIEFEEMKINNIELEGSKYIYLTVNLNSGSTTSNDDNVYKYRKIESIDESIERLFSEKKTYYKTIIQGDTLKIKIPYRYHNFEVETDRLITELEVDMFINNVKIELKNVYILDKGHYQITGSIWQLKSFT